MNLQHITLRSCSHASECFGSNKFYKFPHSPTNVDVFRGKVENEQIKLHHAVRDGHGMVSMDFNATFCETCNQLMPQIKADYIAKRNVNHDKVDIKDKYTGDLVAEFQDGGILNGRECEYIQVSGVPVLIEFVDEKY